MFSCPKISHKDFLFQTDINGMQKMKLTDIPTGGGWKTRDVLKLVLFNPQA